MIGTFTKIPQYQLFRKFGFPRMLPINFTLSVTYRCNSRCKTCHVYTKKCNELSVDEIDKILCSMGETPFWFTMSGGEPFLRNDIVEICKIAYERCKPSIINIPTNGILYERVPQKVKEIVEICPKTQIIINLSIDHIGEKHDEIRGIKNNFQKAMKTYQSLRSLNYKNLALGIHTVISKYNVKDFEMIYEYLVALKPDSYITEIAEQRVELGTIGLDITPSLDDYSHAVNFLCDRIKQRGFKGISQITQAFRLQYYNLVKQILREKRQVLPCYAGFASAHIAPDGDVWMCCIKAEPIGNLREVDYDFKRVWFSEKANKLRQSIINKECYCPLANASYTNMLCSNKSLMKAAAWTFFGRFSSHK
jgi:MoaA/NifB/PqqE/SkfB family radical SAM enzyme